MATDRKADYVGNHGGVYTDLNGMSKQFTVVDHDRKTKISTSVSKGEESTASEQVEEYKRKAALQILAMPAVAAARDRYNLYEHLIERDPEKGIIWKEEVVKNACQIDFLLCYNLWLTVWRNTVKFEYWWGPYLSHEEILEGHWKKIMS